MSSAGSTLAKATDRGAGATSGDVLPVVRATVRELLLASPAFGELEPERRRELAQAMVKVCHRAAVLLEEEIASDAQAKRNGMVRGLASGRTAFPSTPAASHPRLAKPQSAGSEFSGVAASRVASTTQQILNAVSFPRFVTELINGVFKAMLDSNRQQMQSYVELLNNVSASLDGFADANVGNDRAREWLAERYPGSFTVEGESAEEGWGDAAAKSGKSDLWGDETSEASERTLRLRPGAALPSAEALRVDLGLGPDDAVPTGDPDRTLVPLARRALARQRQQMLATMVMLGMQRIVIDSGRIHASMRFHIDTRSAAQEDRGNQFDARHTSTVSGSFGYGPWGASATMTNTIGYVSTQRTQTTEEMNTDLDLNSSVELVFKTDYLPLERMAGQGQIDRIKVNTLNPTEELKAATEERKAREKRIGDSESARRAAVEKSIGSPPSPPAAPKAGAPGSPEAADKARAEAVDREKKEKKPESKPETKPAEKPAAKPETKPETKPGTKSETKPEAKAGPAAETKGPSSSSKEAAKKPEGAKEPAKSEKKAESVKAAGLAQAAESSAPEAESVRRPDVVFVPSPPEAVAEMLELAGVTKNDLVYDLGCGDGRIVIAAARQYGCLGVGFDVDPARVADSRRNVMRNGVSHLVRIEQRDIYTLDLSEADVVTIYLLPELNVKLIPQFARMKPGARIVSQDFDMAGVVPDRVVQVYLDRHGFYKTFYLWTTPLKQAQSPVRHQWLNARGITADRDAVVR